MRDERRMRVFEKRVLRRIFAPKRDEVKEGWRKLHNEELNNLYFSPNTVRVIKSRRMIWTGHAAHMREKRETYTRLWWGIVRKREHIKVQVVDGRIILSWIYRKWDVGVWTGSSWLRLGTGVGHL